MCIVLILAYNHPIVFFVEKVVSILIANVDNIPSLSWGQLYEDVGIANISYSPPTASLTLQEWPTLQGSSGSVKVLRFLADYIPLTEMINNDTRLVTFLDNQADFTQVPYIIDGVSFSILCLVLS